MVDLDLQVARHSSELVESDGLVKWQVVITPIDGHMETLFRRSMMLHICVPAERSIGPMGMGFLLSMQASRILRPAPLASGPQKVPTPACMTCLYLIPKTSLFYLLRYINSCRLECLKKKPPPNMSALPKRTVSCV